MELLLPPLPAPWRELAWPEEELPCIVRIGTADGVRELVTQTGARTIAASVPKEENLPILAYPIIAGRPGLLKPAGALFPLDLDDALRLKLSWENGFLAETLVALSEAPDLRASLNTRRLSRELQSRSEGDPWKLDRQRLLATLPFGAFSADRIRELPLYSLALSAEGRWIADDPFRAPVASSPEGLLCLDRVAQGYCCYFQAAAGGPPGQPARFEPSERLELFVDCSGWLSRNAATGVSEFGRW